MLNGNTEFVAESDDGDFEAFQDGQSPRVTLLSCCDSRVHHNVFKLDATDRMFIIRNIGNQFFPGRGSIDYGVKKLNTPLLIILGHVRCGAVQAAMTDYSEEDSLAIREKLDGLQLPLRQIEPGLNEADAWLRAVELNVDYQVAIAVKRYKDKIDAGELIVAGAVYDFADVYGKGRGRTVLRNVNGETDLAKIGNYEG
ncbi:MAG: carbonic anhydrase [Puniceicoccales bacterium]